MKRPSGYWLRHIQEHMPLPDIESLCLCVEGSHQRIHLRGGRRTPAITVQNIGVRPDRQYLTISNKAFVVIRRLCWEAGHLFDVCRQVTKGTRKEIDTASQLQEFRFLLRVTHRAMIHRSPRNCSLA